MMFRLESMEELLKAFNELDEEGKKKAMREMGSVKLPYGVCPMCHEKLFEEME